MYFSLYILVGKKKERQPHGSSGKTPGWPGTARVETKKGISARITIPENAGKERLCLPAVAENLIALLFGHAVELCSFVL